MSASPGPGFRARILSRARDWKRSPAPIHAFGGRPLLEAELPVSPRAGRPLHLLLDLDLADERLAGLGVSGLRRLAVLADLHLDPGPEATWIRHLDEGRGLELVAEPDAPVVPGVPDELPQLPVELSPLSPAEAAVSSRDEYPEGVGPLHQVGGHPAWVVGPVPPPACPLTGEPMRFVVAVDSMLRYPCGDREAQVLFGDCGTLYVFWSEAARVTASFVQSY